MQGVATPTQEVRAGSPRPQPCVRSLQVDAGFWGEFWR